MSNFTISHQVLKKDGKVRFRILTRNGYDQYRIRLSISGPLSEISHVEYELHPTFREPIRISKDRLAGFPIEFWTWGEFEILVTAHYTDGHEESVTYDLQYGSTLPSSIDAYHDETPASLREAQ